MAQNYEFVLTTFRPTNQNVLASVFSHSNPVGARFAPGSAFYARIILPVPGEQCFHELLRNCIGSINGCNCAVHQLNFEELDVVVDQDNEGSDSDDDIDSD